MPIRLDPLDVSAAVIGSVYTLSWDTFGPAGAYLASTPQQDTSKLFVWNESGAGFNADIPGKMWSTYLPPGGWRTLYLPYDAQAMTLTVSDLIAGGQVNKVRSVYYAPNEDIESDIGILGNSPAGIGGLGGGQQVRVVSVPISPRLITQRGFGLTGAGQDIALEDDTLTNTSPGQVIVYLYFCSFRLSTPGAATNWFADVTLFADLYRGGPPPGGALVQSRIVHNIFCTSVNQSFGFQTSAHDFAPAVASWTNFGAFATPVDTVHWRFHVNNVAAGTPQAFWSLGFGVDLTNQITPGTHGNFTPNTGIF